MSNRDETHRLICTHRITVTEETRTGTEVAPALLEEIAPASMVISCLWSAKIGADLTLDCGTCKFRGKVSHCLSWADGYLVELQLHYDSLWAPCYFMPEGIFNPKCLVCREPGCVPNCVKPRCIGN